MTVSRCACLRLLMSDSDERASLRENQNVSVHSESDGCVREEHVFMTVPATSWFESPNTSINSKLEGSKGVFLTTPPRPTRAHVQIEQAQASAHEPTSISRSLSRASLSREAGTCAAIGSLCDCQTQVRQPANHSRTATTYIGNAATANDRMCPT